MWKKPDGARGLHGSSVACSTLLDRAIEKEVGLQISSNAFNHMMD